MNEVDFGKEEDDAGIELDLLLKEDRHYHFLHRKLKSLDDILSAVLEEKKMSSSSKKLVEMFYFTERKLLEFSFECLEKDFPDELVNRFPEHVYEEYSYESKIYSEKKFKFGKPEYLKIDALLEKDRSGIDDIISHSLFKKSVGEVFNIGNLKDEKLDVIHYMTYKENGSYFFKIDGLSELIPLNSQEGIYEFLKHFKDNLTSVDRNLLVNKSGGENEFTGLKRRVSKILDRYSFEIESIKKDNKTSYKIRKK